MARLEAVSPRSDVAREVTNRSPRKVRAERERKCPAPSRTLPYWTPLSMVFVMEDFRRYFRKLPGREG